MIEIKSQPAWKYHTQVLENFRASSSDGVCSCVAGAREGEGESQDSTNINNINNLVQSRESSQTAAQGGQEVSAANIKKILRFVSPPVLYRGLAVTELVFSVSELARKNIEELIKEATEKLGSVPCDCDA